MSARRMLEGTDTNHMINGTRFMTGAVLGYPYFVITLITMDPYIHALISTTVRLGS